MRKLIIPISIVLVVLAFLNAALGLYAGGAALALREESEGSKVTVPAGYAPDECRLVGKIRGEAPFSGVLVHHGWRTESVKLPRLLRTGDDRLPTIAPSEIELK